MSQAWSLARKLFGLVAFLGICIHATKWAAADLITKPVVGNYRLVFVTSASTNPIKGSLPSMDDYNDFVTTAADAVPALAALGTSWYAIGSTSDVDARDNIPGDSVIYDLAGNRVADSFADLWDGSIQTAITQTEIDGTAYSGKVWTGTDSDGTASGDPLANAGSITYGTSNVTGAGWINTAAESPTPFYPFYAISGVIPEPGSLSLAVSMALLGAGGGWYRRRKRRNKT